MGLRRIATPHDLGAAVRDARTAAQLTQAELAHRAGVSREWLIGLERGTRPRAELTKILGVLSVLDVPITLGDGQEPQASGGEPESERSGNAMTTAEITRRAIERSRRPGGVTSLGPGASASAVVARGQERRTDAVVRADFATHPAPMAPATHLASRTSRTDLSALMRRTDVAALMPQPSAALQSLMSEFSTASPAAGDDQRGDHEGDQDLTHERNEGEVIVDSVHEEHPG